MPRRQQFDLAELLAAWDSGDFQTASAVMEFLGIPDEARRSVQRAINKYRGGRPKRAAANRYWPKQALLKYLVDELGLKPNYCSMSQEYCGGEVYLRQLGRDDRLDTIVIVGKCCKRAGDY